MANPCRVAEATMMPALLAMLRSSRRVRIDTLMATELPWRGRRIDLATMTRRGILTAYELKLDGFGRVLEQAIYNRLSFDRSWIVVSAVPSIANLKLAEKQEIGVIVVRVEARIVISAPCMRNEQVLRQRLSSKIRLVGVHDV